MSFCRACMPDKFDAALSKKHAPILQRFINKRKDFELEALFAMRGSYFLSYFKIRNCILFYSRIWLNRQLDYRIDQILHYFLSPLSF